ncbi:MAG: 30S ribosomal protein S7 [Chloroflexota bacterium]
MSRRARVFKKPAIADPRYNSALLAKFINKVMMRGEKALAQRLVYGALDVAKEKVKNEPVKILEQAIKNATPMLSVKPRRVGGATYQVPMEVAAAKGTTLAIRWIVGAARSRGGKSMVDKLAAEFCDAFQSQGTAVKRREDTHKMADANKAFAHYRW